MSSSAARIAANAANAQHSTGPRTPQGQARSSQNARKHGLTAREIVVADNEREEFEELLNDYQTDVQPQRGLQQTIFEELVAAAWNLRRARRMEVEFSADTSLTDEDRQNKLDCLARNKGRVERTFYRALKELKTLQTNILIQATLPPAIRRHVPPLSHGAEMAKRTHQFDQRNELALLKAILEAPPPVRLEAD